MTDKNKEIISVIQKWKQTREGASAARILHEYADAICGNLSGTSSTNSISSYDVREACQTVIRTLAWLTMMKSETCDKEKEAILTLIRAATSNMEK